MLTCINANKSQLRRWNQANEISHTSEQQGICSFKMEMNTLSQDCCHESCFRTNPFFYSLDPHTPYTKPIYIYIYTFLFIAQFRMGRINARIYTYIEMLTSIESHKYCHPTCSPKRCNTIHSFISLKRLACIFPYRMSVGFFVAVEQHAHVSCLDGHLLIATILHAFYTQ